ncbi:dTMP kinase [Malassezia caprae]|uniref:Thymidylate kinase n=1 Tax=Malassezia caprae TaxID=1381934 RepID=A0AAF0J0H1_9BASI|nr:dTMP kinase [Malassezia caprae]
MAKNLPPSIQVFIAHGIADNIVPVEDAPGIANIISAHPRRQPGTVHVELLPQCDHNYRGDATNSLLESMQSWMKKSTESCYKPRPLPLPVSSTRRGALIVVEGLDRSGKSTQVERLVQHLQARHVKFPERTTAIGSMINAYLTRQSDINDHAVHLLFSANRWEIIESILQSLQRGQNVVCDRYAFSGIAYTWAKGLPLDWCIGSDAGIPIPDVTLFLDLDEKTASARAAYGEERYEKRAFQEKVRHAFYQVESFVQYAGGHWIRIDASGTPDQVWQTIQRHAGNVVSHGPMALYPLDLEAMRPALPWTKEGPEKASL